LPYQAGLIPDGSGRQRCRKPRAWNGVAVSVAFHGRHRRRATAESVPWTPPRRQGTDPRRVLSDIAGRTLQS